MKLDKVFSSILLVFAGYILAHKEASIFDVGFAFYCVIFFLRMWDIVPRELAVYQFIGLLGYSICGFWAIFTHVNLDLLAIILVWIAGILTVIFIPIVALEAFEEKGKVEDKKKNE